FLPSLLAVRPFQTRDELVERNGGHRHAGHPAAGAQLDRHPRDRGVVRRVDHGHEIVRPEPRALRHNASAHALDVGVAPADPPRSLAEHLAPGFGERTEHHVETHRRAPFPRSAQKYITRIVEDSGLTPSTASRTIPRPRAGATS